MTLASCSSTKNFDEKSDDKSTGKAFKPVLDWNDGCSFQRILKIPRASASTYSLRSLGCKSFIAAHEENIAFLNHQSLRHNSLVPSIADVQVAVTNNIHS